MSRDASGPTRIAILGAGAAGSAAVYGMRRHAQQGLVALTVFETGRGAGGRATTRRTRERPGLRIDHGAPCFTACSASFKALCAQFREAGVLEEAAEGACGTLLAGSGDFHPDGCGDEDPAQYVGGARGMAGFSEALLAGGDAQGAPLANCRFGTMVRGIDPIPTAQGGGWRLRNEAGPLGDFDWLVVSASVTAHPRWRNVFGGEPPLATAAALRDDAWLSAAVEAIQAMESQPTTTALLAFEGEAARAWAALPWVRAQVEDDAVLAKVVVQRLGDGLTAVVLHSTEEFAQRAKDVYGAKSAVTQVTSASSSPGREAEILAALSEAMRTRMVPRWLTEEHLAPVWGPHLHRWGSAFPKAPLLDPALAVATGARVGICGDFIAGPHAGSVEGAVLSGLDAAEAIAARLPSPSL